MGTGADSHHDLCNPVQRLPLRSVAIINKVIEVGVGVGAKHIEEDLCPYQAAAPLNNAMVAALATTNEVLGSGLTSLAGNNRRATSSNPRNPAGSLAVHQLLPHTPRAAPGTGGRRARRPGP